jgi:hypothetical protein
MAFKYARDFSRLDLRRHPELYQIGRGEQGVLLVEPYKSELLPHWRFLTPAIARKSAAALYRMFLAYRSRGDFVGINMARKFLQMGYIRSRRNANRASGRKYATRSRKLLPRKLDASKAESARIFQAMWRKAREDATYLRLKKAHRDRERV